MILLIIGVLIGILGTALIYLIVVDCDRKLLDARMDVYGESTRFLGESHE